MYSGSQKRFVVSISIVLIFLSYSVLLAKPVSVEQVWKVSDTFLKVQDIRQGKQLKILSLGITQKLPSKKPTATRIKEICSDDGTVVAYVTELEPQGFIAASADTDITPIIAHSFKSNFPQGNDKNNVLYHMLRKDMELRLQAISKYNESKIVANNQAWELYGAEDLADAGDGDFQQWPEEDTTLTGGWVETTWHQHSPYNDFCPLDPIEEGRCLVGCVATAMAQIINYHKHLGSLSFGDSDEYATLNGINIDADSTTYDFPSFGQLNTYLDTISFKYKNDIDLDNTDIASLNFACGISTDTDYSHDGSGAFPWAARNALLNKFNFYSANMIGGLSGESYSLLQENIINGLPAFLAIRKDNGSHFIVCDGYNTNNEYHLNFGWGSSNPEIITEAWYQLPIGIPSGYTVVQDVTLNIRPWQPSIDVSPASLTFYSRPGQNSESEIVYIQNNTTQDTLIDSISSSDGFIIAHSSDIYSNFIDSFSINAGQTDSISVIFSLVEAGSYHGLLTINYDNGNIKYVILKGSCFSGGMEIPAGNVSGTWSQANSPYYIDGDIQVGINDSLVIEPGVKVIFVGYYRMTVGENASLIAEGTESSWIEFTALDKHTGWNGLRFIDSGNDDRLKHCYISYSRKTYDPATWKGDEDTYGGGLYCRNSNPTIANCKITNNVGTRGGGIAWQSRSCPLIINTLIANNSAIGGCPQGGGIYCYGGMYEVSSPIMTNCTVVNNLPDGVYTSGGPILYLTNTIVWGNCPYQITKYHSEPIVWFCNVQDGYAAEGNIEADPCFVEPSLGVGADYDGLSANWAIQSSSACINSGIIEANELSLPATDLAGNPRIYSNIIDIGAYENQSELPLITTVPSSFVDMGFIHIDTNSTRDVNVINAGEIDFKIHSLNIHSGTNNAFSIMNPIRDYTLLAGESIRVELQFNPEQEMQYTGTLHIYSDSSNCAHKQISLRGVGVTGTIIPAGPVSGTWTKAESPFSIAGDISVAEGKKLTIEPGVVVKFTGHFGLTVGYHATLHAIGTEADNIVFTATDTDEGWFGIRFINSENDDILRYCRIEYSKKPKTGGGGDQNLMGGGIFCWCIMRPEFGMAIYSSPTIDHCLIANNHAHYGGGIMIVRNIDREDIGRPPALITNNVIVNNSSGTDGGGIYLNQAWATVSNNIIANNSGSWSGGIATWGGCPSFINNTIVNNRPNGLLLGGPNPGCALNPLVKNNIIWLNEIYMCDYKDIIPTDYDICYNSIQGGWEGEGNINADPLFVDTDNGDFHLQAGSPCIDSGDNTAVPLDTVDLDGDSNTTEPTPWDLDSNLRFFDDPSSVDIGNGIPPIVDMGAYEFGSYRILGDLNADSDVNLLDLAMFATHWLEIDCGACDGADLNNDGNIDFNDLIELADNWLEGIAR